MYLNLPDFSTLLSQARTYPIPEDLSVRWATVMKLVDLIQSETCSQETADAALTYIGRVPATDMQAMAVRELFKSKGKAKLVASPVFKNLATKISKAL